MDAFRYLLILLLVLGFCLSYALGRLPLLVPLCYGLLSLLAILNYARDKRAARKGLWRVSESALHTIALLGGWPGAMLGQNLLRHKTRKLSFQAVFWLTVILNLAALAGLHTPEGERWGREASARLAATVRARSSGFIESGSLYLLRYRHRKPLQLGLFSPRPVVPGINA